MTYLVVEEEEAAEEAEEVGGEQRQVDGGGAGRLHHHGHEAVERHHAEGVNSKEENWKRPGRLETLSSEARTKFENIESKN